MREKSSNLFNFGGNFPCLICGKGDECEMSGVPLLFGEGAKASADKCIAVEDQTDAWNQAFWPGRDNFHASQYSLSYHRE